MSVREKRGKDELRPIEFHPGYLIHPQGSCFVKWGNTWVICSAQVEERVPAFLQNTHTGWITAEYSMIPGATDPRITREQVRMGGRTKEIQRMIGRSLRGVTNLEILGERTMHIDCEVIQADGGTRMASVAGGFIALLEAVSKLKRDRVITRSPIREYLGGVSVGKVKGDYLLDLNYEEDSQAEVDMNIVMTESGKFVEIQGSAEGCPFSREEINALLNLASQGIEEIIRKIKEVTKDIWMGF
ncbi:ribonuclease PH [Candidatus Calescamantes bacterium]|nr:ribonuclease PH [Candidatus Calescamantes bacterium]